ncbi:hypothetical protein EQH54_23540, partial [Escherichia coli]|uniref:immunoglobulin-like domain-containing protein n=1 Tax=Escherichia coli TaxID=562 RepID=UPI000FEEB0D3
MYTVRADDAVLNGTDNLSVSISSTSGGNFEAVSSTGTVANTVVDDTDTTTVTLSSTTSGTAITEGGSITYTATVGAQVTGSALVVTLSNGQTITIPVGSSTGTAVYTVRADDAVLNGTDNLSVSISSTSGGNFEAV